MLEKLRYHLSNHTSINSGSQLLLAVSGGLDSVVMTHLLHQLKFSCSIAHVNFGLRGTESDGDENFVRALATQLDMPFYLKKADTLKFSEEKKISIQMAAREIRYEWFQELKSDFSYSQILTAHHSDDSIETMLINMIRGTGISGLKGIRDNDDVIRPLLIFSREEILNYAKENKLFWREDSSNIKEDYLRNKIRHSIIPKLNEISLGWKEQMLKLSDDAYDSDKLLHQHYEQRINIILQEDKILWSKVQEEKDGKWLLRRYLHSLEFSHAEINDLLSKDHYQSGSRFISTRHSLSMDRNIFFISKNDETNLSPKCYQIQNPEVREVGTSAGDWKFNIIESLSKDFKYKKEEAYLDLDKLSFPLIIRKWEKGDYFIPLGMTGKKKLSDFFIDEKFPIHKKENTFVLLSQGQIVWVSGNRIDERYRISTETKQIYHIKIDNG